MRTVTIDVLDESKTQLLLDVLNEFRFIRVAPPQAAASPVKIMQTLPPSILHPHTAQTFTTFLVNNGRKQCGRPHYLCKDGGASGGRDPETVFARGTPGRPPPSLSGTSP